MKLFQSLHLKWLPHSIRPFFWITIILWSIWWGFWLFSSSNPEIRGQSGDHFGSLNALFTGFSCIGLAYTIYQQFKLTERQEFERKQDNVERRFFQMSDGHRSLSSSLAGLIPDVNKANSTLMAEGKAYFEGVCATINLGPIEGPPYTLDEVTNCQKYLFSTFGNSLAPFVASFKCILKYLDREGGASTHDYVTLLVSELSPAETIILSIWPLGKNDLGFMGLLQKHNVLRFMPKTTRFGFSRTRMRNFYPSTIFEWEH